MNIIIIFRNFNKYFPYYIGIRRGTEKEDGKEKQDGCFANYLKSREKLICLHKEPTLDFFHSGLVL